MSPLPRQAYVRPSLTQLEFVSDGKVSLLTTCKTSTSASGPAVSGCLTDPNQGPQTPCQSTIS